MSFAKLLGVISPALLICSALTAKPHRLESRATGPLADFIAGESPLALQGVLNNIGLNGSTAPGASPGVVIGSPSTTNLIVCGSSAWISKTSDSTSTLLAFRCFVVACLFDSSTLRLL